MTTSGKTNNFTRFLRNNAALLLLILSILAIVTVVLVVTLSPDAPVPDNPVTGNPNDDPIDKPVDKPDDPVIPQKIKVYFASPVQYQSVSMDYTDGSDVLFVFNATLNSWKTHHGVDLVATDGTTVTAMFDGTVVDVTESYGMGHVVKIDHGDNVVATYASLADVQVVKGQQVTKGESIGVVSTSASYEFVDGAHLHLEVAVNGVNTDPMPYVNGEIFREQDAE